MLVQLKVESGFMVILFKSPCLNFAVWQGFDSVERGAGTVRICCDSDAFLCRTGADSDFVFARVLAAGKF